jgi:hypothetical protein
VRWSDDGHVGFVIPGSDAFIEHFVHSSNAGHSR